MTPKMLKVANFPTTPLLAVIFDKKTASQKPWKKPAPTDVPSHIHISLLYCIRGCSLFFCASRHLSPPQHDRHKTASFIVSTYTYTHVISCLLDVHQNLRNKCSILLHSYFSVFYLIIFSLF